MTEYISFLREQLELLAGMLDYFSFDIFGISASLLEIFLGFVVMSIIICLFWKGARG